jgi:hypothetical protein
MIRPRLQSVLPTVIKTTHQTIYRSAKTQIALSLSLSLSLAFVSYALSVLQLCSQIGIGMLWQRCTEFLGLGSNRHLYMNMSMYAYIHMSTYM